MKRSNCIETSRFFLRPLTVSDVTNTYLGWLDGAMAREHIVYAQNDKSLEDLKEYVSQKEGRHDILFLGIFAKKNGHHVGNLKYEPIDFKNRTAVMGILIGSECWQGQGVAQEVIEASVDLLNKKFGIERIELGVDVSHKAAIKAYRKLGFEFGKTSLIKTAQGRRGMYKENGRLSE